MHPKRRRLVSESNSSASGESVQSTCITSTGSAGSSQTNYIMVENPTGSTTIYVSSASTPASQTQIVHGAAEATNPPGDIALMKKSQPVQPTEKRFPVTLSGIKPRSFNLAWF